MNLSLAFSIRPYRETDATSLSRLYARSVNDLGPRHYSPTQVEAWASLAPDAAAINARMDDRRTRLVAAGPDNAAIGFVDVETDGHVDLLYVDPPSAGRGVGRSLLQAAIDLGHPRLFAEASEVALPLFERMGFVVTSRRDLKIGGVAIHNWAVERRRP